MKEKILNLIKLSKNDESVYKDLESVFDLYEQLQYSMNIKQMAEDIYNSINYTENKP